MKGMRTMTMPGRAVTERKAMIPVMLRKHELMIRREPNHNVHIITPHGKVQLGRKGRTG